MNAEMQRIETSWNELVELVNQVQAAGGLTRVGSDGWSVKDHLAHIGAWEHSLLALIEGRDRLAGMGLQEPVDENTDAVNEAVRKVHENDTADEALGYFRSSSANTPSSPSRLAAVLIAPSGTSAKTPGIDANLSLHVDKNKQKLHF